MSFTVSVNGTLYELSKDDAIGTIVKVGEKFNLSRKEMLLLATKGEITTKDGIYIEVYKNV